MTYSYFQNFRAKITKNDLPGRAAQLLMTPQLRQKELLELDFDSLSPKEAAVMCLLYPDQNNVLRFPLILRNKYPGVHSNQVSFPGGKLDTCDDSFLACALRETNEEIGVPTEDIQLLKQLTDVYIPPSNFLVKSFVGLLEKAPQFTPEPNEVQQIIQVSLDHLLDENSIIEETITTSYAKSIKVQAFNLEGHVVWGATAMILSELKVLLSDVFS